MAPVSDNSKRNIIFCGETGAGKSSTINLLLQTGALAGVSNGSQPCTQVGARYETTLNGTRCNLWDTRGLGEGRNFFQAIFRRSSDKELKMFLKERHQRHELDLLVYCVRGSRANAASLKYYNDFCAITRRLVAPVVIVVTHVERETDMEDWWNKNSSRLEELEMEFDGHVCITTLAGHPREAESKRRLIDLITRNRRWAAIDSGSYFGSRVQKSTPSAPPPKGGISRFFKPKDSGGVGNGGLERRPSNHTGPSTTTSSPRNSSYHTAESPRESVPTTPIVEPPTPCSAATPARLPQIDTDHLKLVSDPLQSTSEETSSTRSSLHSIFHISPHSSYTSNSEVHLQPCTEENEDYLSELPFKYPNVYVRRKKGYPTQHGGFGDVWECELISGEPYRMVAVKAVKAEDDEDLRSHEKKLRRELKVWGRLRHKNIVPLLGVVSGFGPLPSMVSPWFSNGSLSRYLARHQLLKLSEKHRLLKDIAAGLSYLHSQGVVHGDLHSDNVLIDEDGTACLTDFGLSMIKDFVGTSYLKSNICGGVQFVDPALVQRIESSQDIVCYPTKPCDVYSFGGLMLHVLSGKKPYEDIRPITAIFTKVSKGVQPQIPSHVKHVTPWHKSLIQRCWDHEEPKRPSANDLARMFAPQ